jgi:hypothetical protein
VRFGSVRYSTPPGHVDSKVWCRVVGDELVIVAMTAAGAQEIARHVLSTPGTPRIVDAHYPHHPGGNHPRPPRPRPRTKAEADFLELGDGAHSWLVEAAATGASRVRAKMARAVELSRVLGADPVDQALGLAAAAGRFDEHDLGSILDHLASHGAPADVVRADETHSAQPGTSSWGRFGKRGRPMTPTTTTPASGAATSRARRAAPRISSTPAAPALPAELEALLRRMRLPYLRAAAPDVLATAKAQRWDPAEVLRVLIAEEVIGRDAATRRMRRKTANFPSGKTFATWRPADSTIPAPTQQALSTLEWLGRAENLAVAGPSGTGKSHFVEALAHTAIEADLRVAWFTLETPRRHHRPGQGRRLHRPHRGPDLVPL